MFAIQFSDVLPSSSSMWYSSAISNALGLELPSNATERLCLQPSCDSNSLERGDVCGGSVEKDGEGEGPEGRTRMVVAVHQQSTGDRRQTKPCCVSHDNDHGPANRSRAPGLPARAPLFLTMIACSAADMSVDMISSIEASASETLFSFLDNSRDEASATA
ncbi:hypothetical protein AC579_1981 [Pseudocercospora musae]|uniref:Uncharacterized protein n=1 Tax=Pseudocercospora musae TaxID=113226 RepID=A0A139I8M4_9PEZI|nr:hypothetical protein AC579_1981 [Pseudocercospora musae]